MGMCEQCTNESKYTVGEIGLCEPCHEEYLNDSEQDTDWEQELT